MFAMHKGDCEHCSRTFHYVLLNAGIGDFSYAYCDACGMLATLAYSNREVSYLPQSSETHQDIPRDWEPYLRPCACGGRFRKSASPRCVYCNSILSADFAAGHIERNSIGATRGWHWQRNWSDIFCMALEDPHNPGNLRQVSDIQVKQEDPIEKPARRSWTQIFSLGR
jgi:hypothetical protein